mgnify:CR=1 FL=1
MGVNCGKKETNIDINVHISGIQIREKFCCKNRKKIWGLLPAITSFSVLYLVAEHTHLDEFKYTVPDGCYHSSCWDMQTTGLDVFLTLMGAGVLLGIVGAATSKLMGLMYPDNKE